jgi:hypothetical protein
MDGLPFVDEHRVAIAAPTAEVWRALVVRLRRFGGSEAVARLLGADPGRAAGEPLDEGATVVGFAVAESIPEQRVRLVGRHRFSRYALELDLAVQPDGTTLSALTYAEFPGLRGALYRGLVIGSGAHRVLVRRLLRDVRRHAEQTASAGSDQRSAAS